MSSRLSRRILFFGLIATVVFVEILDYSAAAILLPAIADEWNVPEVKLTAFIISFTVGVLSVISTVPWLSSNYGNDRVLSAGLFLFGLGALGCSLANSITMLFLFRFLQGVGAGIMGTVARAALVQAAERSELARVMGFVGFPAMLGPIVGPVLAAFLSVFLGWRSYFVIVAAWSVLLIVPAIGLFRPNANQTPREFDWLGILILLGIFGSLLVLSELKPFQHTVTFALLVLCFVVLCYWYVHHAQHRASPALSLNLFRHQSFSFWALGNISLRLAVSGLPLGIAIIVQATGKHSLITSGFLIGAFAVGMALARPTAGWFEEILGTNYSLIYPAIAVAVLLLCLSIIPANAFMNFLPLPIFLIGCATSVAYNAIHASAYRMAPKAEATDITILLTFMQHVSTALAALIILQLLPAEGTSSLGWLALPAFMASLSFSFLQRRSTADT